MKYEVGRTWIVYCGSKRPLASYSHTDVEKIIGIWKNLPMSQYKIVIKISETKKHTVESTDIPIFLERLRETGSSLLAYK